MVMTKNTKFIEHKYAAVPTVSHCLGLSGVGTALLHTNCTNGKELVALHDDCSDDTSGEIHGITAH